MTNSTRIDLFAAHALSGLLAGGSSNDWEAVKDAWSIAAEMEKQAAQRAAILTPSSTAVQKMEDKVVWSDSRPHSQVEEDKTKVLEQFIVVKGITKAEINEIKSIDLNDMVHEIWPDCPEHYGKKWFNQHMNNEDFRLRLFAVATPKPEPKVAILPPPTSPAVKQNRDNSLHSVCA
jgi:hypothetical protein